MRLTLERPTGDNGVSPERILLLLYLLERFHASLLFNTAQQEKESIPDNTFIRVLYLSVHWVARTLTDSLLGSMKPFVMHVNDVASLADDTSLSPSSLAQLLQSNDGLFFTNLLVQTRALETVQRTSSVTDFASNRFIQSSWNLLSSFYRSEPSQCPKTSEEYLAHVRKAFNYFVQLVFHAVSRTREVLSDSAPDIQVVAEDRALSTLADLVLQSFEETDFRCGMFFIPLLFLYVCMYVCMYVCVYVT
jgi:hypothetical protein